METRHGIEYRQLHIEDYLGKIPAEQGRRTGVYAHEWITGNPDTNADFWTEVLPFGYNLPEGQAGLMECRWMTILSEG